MSQPPAPMAPPPAEPEPPRLLNRQTALPRHELSRRLHPAEIPWLIVICVLGAFAYLGSFVFVVLWLVDVFSGGGGTFGFRPGTPQYESLQQLSGFIFGITVLAVMLYVIRGLNYAQMRVNGVRLTPTQFPEGYRMLVEAAEAAGMRKVPDAYVVSGGGTINAFASGHAWRRFIVVYSDLFEVGGAARDPEALKFVIGHEVGHLGAGHVSYWRQWLTAPVLQLPLLGSFLSRTQEYTADNFGHYYAGPKGAAGAMKLLSGGKYLNANVNFDEFSDRAFQEKGLFVWASNVASSHPILLWRAQALRDRSQPGRIFLRPKGNPSGTPSLPGGSDPTPLYPTPREALHFIDQYPPKGSPQFGAVFPKPLPGEEITTDTSEYGHRMLVHRWAGQQGPGPQGPGGPGPQGPGPGGPGPQGPGGQPPMNWGGNPSSYGSASAPGSYGSASAPMPQQFGQQPQSQQSQSQQSQSQQPLGQQAFPPQPAQQPPVQWGGTSTNPFGASGVATPQSAASANAYPQSSATPPSSSPGQQAPYQQAPYQQAPYQQGAQAQGQSTQDQPAPSSSGETTPPVWGGPPASGPSASPFLAPSANPAPAQSSSSASEPTPRRAQPEQPHRPVAPPAQDDPGDPTQTPSWDRSNDPWNRGQGQS